MRKSTNKEFLERKAFSYAVDNYCNITDCFISSYKNYSYCITNFYNNLSPMDMSIVIFKLTKNKNIKIVYENNYLDNIDELFGKNFKNNSIDTVRRKMRDFIKKYIEE